MIKDFYTKYPFPNNEINEFSELQKHSWILNVLKFPIEKDSEILDAGCGTGEISCFFTQFGNVTGVDFSITAIAKANELKKKLNVPNVNFIVGDLTNLKLKKKFDYIFSIGVLHHIPEREKAFTELKKYLKDDGHLIISVYNRYGKFLWLKRIKKRGIENISQYKDTFENPYKKFYSQKEFEEVLKENGFKIINVWRNIPEWVRAVTGRGDLMTFNCMKTNL